MRTRSTEYSIHAARSSYVCMCVPRNPPEVRLRLLLIRRHRLRLRRTSPSPSDFSRCYPIAKPFATGRRCPQVVASRPSRSVSRTFRCETFLSPRVRCTYIVCAIRASFTLSSRPGFIKTINPPTAHVHCHHHGVTTIPITLQDIPCHVINATGKRKL